MCLDGVDIDNVSVLCGLNLDEVLRTTVGEKIFASVHTSLKSSLATDAGMLNDNTSMII